MFTLHLHLTCYSFKPRLERTERVVKTWLLESKAKISGHPKFIRRGSLPYYEKVLAKQVVRHSACHSYASSSNAFVSSLD